MAFDLGAIASIGGAIGSLFGGKKKTSGQTTYESNMDLMAAARVGARRYGFNPLTILQNGHAGNSMAAGGAPPLASIEMLAGGLAAIDDERSGDAARRRAADQLEIDLAKLKLDQARSGVIAAGPGVHAIGSGPSPLGRRAVVEPSAAGTAFVTPRPSLASSASLGIRPPQSPVSRSREMVPVIYPDGVTTQLPRGITDRLGLKPFDTMVAADLEDLRGEAVGNAESAIRSPDMYSYSETGEPAVPSSELEYDKNGKKWVPPFTDPKSKSWWRRPLF